MKLVSERITVDDYAARTAARIQGVSDLALVVVPHRRGGETAEDQRGKADGALPSIVASLVQPM